MTPQRILLLCDSFDHINATKQVVNELMREFGATVSGIVGTEAPTHERTPVERYFNGPSNQERQEAKTKQHDLREHFYETFGKNSPSVTWRESVADTSAAVLEDLLYFDLIVCAQPQYGDPLSYPSMLHSVVLKSPRPVLIVPEATEDFDIRGTASIAWTPTNEAARAVGSALPLLSRASKVLIASQSVNENVQKVSEHTDRLALYLAHKDIAATCEVQRTSTSSPAKLFKKLELEGAEYIVVGAWGHSRVLEWVIGGFTRYAINWSSLPVWIAH